MLLIDVTLPKNQFYKDMDEVNKTFALYSFTYITFFIHFLSTFFFSFQGFFCLPFFLVSVFVKDFDLYIITL